MASHGSEIEEFLRFYGLSVALSDAKGRCLVASRPFRRGKWILSPFTLLEANAHDEWLCCFCVKLQDALCVSYLEENSVDSVWERDEFVCEGAKILEQEPYVAVLEAGAQNKRCDRCYTKSSTVKRCSACKSVFYCCADCQVIASFVPVPLGVLGLRATL